MTLYPSIPAYRFEAGKYQETEEKLLTEAALQIKINHRPYTVTMRTPGSEAWLTTGLLFTEGIITGMNDILSLQETIGANGLVQSIDIGLPKEIVTKKHIFNRSIASSSSCGICGKTELCDIEIPTGVLATGELTMDLIPSLFEQLRNHQILFDQTGGSHAAGIFNGEGLLLSAQEDIGRHNAVDKAIGELLTQQTLEQARILCVSGRISYEIVAKCVQAGIPFLLSVSAPSSLAVETCQHKGITLIAFCRNDRATVYTHTERVKTSILI
ncbi:formate dehydrogenase accessory sulfurtransferase FdhD [Xanthocytophaga agilis]|uniref:Sulfur carrier protein FdhD n=1 Tax=Xanthocytophaga agilis TaxID=3048010 RepID=A0AAE3R4U8_9BACT|nr:formate dehydrogenase accessory sulfurtransferase FdhD [Xanthocytophaga agilis]MDJ1503691.1 formate dehydrogenase accessory sulfurtransferase FdhD [Xanthocytophaga agilis]